MTLNAMCDNAFPSELAGDGQYTIVFQLESLVEIMYRMTVRFKRHRAFEIPFHQQSPQIRVLVTENSQLAYRLIMTEPAPTAGSRSIYW